MENGKKECAPRNCRSICEEKKKQETPPPKKQMQTPKPD